MPGWTKDAILHDLRGRLGQAQGAVCASTSAGNFQAEGEAIGRAKGVSPGDYAILETPGHDAVAIRVKIDDERRRSRTRFARRIRGDSILSRTIELVRRGGRLHRAPGQGLRWCEIVGSEGDGPQPPAHGATPVRRSTWRAASGLHARQASLLALSAEPNEVYPHDMLDLRIIGDPFAGSESCARDPLPGRPPWPMPYVQVPMCTPIQLEVTLKRDPVKDLYLGILFLANDGTIAAWPQAGHHRDPASQGRSVHRAAGHRRPRRSMRPIASSSSAATSRCAGRASRPRRSARSAESPRAKRLQVLRDLSHVGGTRGIGRRSLPTTAATPPGPRRSCSCR